jgi:hypothetical protein
VDVLVSFEYIPTQSTIWDCGEKTITIGCHKLYLAGKETQQRQENNQHYTGLVLQYTL